MEACTDQVEAYFYYTFTIKNLDGIWQRGKEV